MSGRCECCDRILLRTTGTRTLADGSKVEETFCNICRDEVRKILRDDYFVKGTEATAFVKWNEGIYDRFKPSLIPGDPDLASTGSNSPSGSGGAGIEDTLQSYEQAMNKSPQCFGLTP